MGEFEGFSFLRQVNADESSRDVTGSILVSCSLDADREFSNRCALTTLILVNLSLSLASLIRLQPKVLESYIRISPCRPKYAQNVDADLLCK